MLYPHPQLRPKPLSRALPQPSHRRLGDLQCCHPVPPGRSKRLGRVQDSRPANSSRPSRSDASSAQGTPSEFRSVPRRMNSLSNMFLIFSHERDGPLRYRPAARLETMPSKPRSATALKNLAPSPSRWSLNWIAERYVPLRQLGTRGTPRDFQSHGHKCKAAGARRSGAHGASDRTPPLPAGPGHCGVGARR
jgi:hypothetical protein